VTKRLKGVKDLKDTLLSLLTKLWIKLKAYYKGLAWGETYRKIVGTAITISILTLVCQLVALVKELWVAARFGTSDSLDAFIMAMVIPTFVINVISGSFHSAFIPEYIYIREKGSLKEAQNLFSNVTAYSLILLLMISIIVIFLSHLFLPILASGFHTEKLALTQTFLYWLIPVIIIQGIIVLWSAVLNACNRFILTAIVPVFLPLSIIIILVTIGSQWSVFSLVIGTLLGLIIQVPIIGWGLKQQNIKILPRWGMNNTHIRRLMNQYTHLIVGAFMMCCTNLVDQSMAAMLDPGSVAALNYGSRIVNVGLGLIATSLATTSFPYFSKQVAQKDWTTLWQISKLYLRWIFIMGIPVSVFIFIFSPQIIQLLYERGAFLRKDTYLVANIQSLFVWQIPFYIGGMLLAKIISSFQANHILMWVSGLNLLLKVTMNYLFIQWMGVSGIALSTSLMYLGSFLFVYYFVRILISKSMKESQIHESE
jgi:putative peptidoglycan lipid II flippase